MKTLWKYTSALSLFLSLVLTGCGGEPIEEPPAEYNTLTECAIGDWLFTEEKGVTYFETNYVFHEDGTVELKKFVDVDNWELWLNAGETGNDVEIFPGVDLTLEQIGIVLWLSNYTGYFYTQGTYTVDEDAQQIIMTYPRYIVGQSRWGYNRAKSDFTTEKGNAGTDIEMTTESQTINCEDNQLIFASFGNKTGNLKDPITGSQTHIDVNPDTMIGRFIDYTEPTPSQSIDYYQLSPIDGGYALNACSAPQESGSNRIYIDTSSGEAVISEESGPLSITEANIDETYAYFAIDGFLYRRNKETGNEQQLDSLVQGYNNAVVFDEFVAQYAITEIDADSDVYETRLRLSYKDGSTSRELTLPFYAVPTGRFGSIALEELYATTKDRIFYFNPDTLEYGRIEPGRKDDYDGYWDHQIRLFDKFARIKYMFTTDGNSLMSVYTLLDLETGEEVDNIPTGEDSYVTDVYHNGELLYVSTYLDEDNYTRTINIEARAYGQAPELRYSYSFSVSSLFVPPAGPFEVNYNSKSGVLYLGKVLNNEETYIINLNNFSTLTTSLYVHKNLAEWQVVADRIPGHWDSYDFPQDMNLYAMSPEGNATLLPKTEENRRTGYQIWKDTIFVSEQVKRRNDVKLVSFSTSDETLKEYQLPGFSGHQSTTKYWPPVYSGSIKYQKRHYYLNTITDEFELLEYPDQSFLNEIQNVEPIDDNLLRADLITFEQSCSTASSGTLRQEGPAFWIEWNDGTTSRDLTTFARQ
ncbi:hypothetical protein [Thalassolituus sp.]|uniref:hypothetical protein n=2 Tax=Thalassolituus sp. TaxID=2030822 RepID=UPI003511F9CD